MRAILWPSMSYQDKLCPVLSTMMAGKYTAGGQVVTSPAVVNGVVYTGPCEQNVYAFNADTGSEGALPPGKPCSSPWIYLRRVNSPMGSPLLLRMISRNGISPGSAWVAQALQGS